MKRVLKRAVRVMPARWLVRIADWRCGGALIQRAEPLAENDGQLTVRVDRIVFSVNTAWREDLRFHFSTNIDSRRELLAFAREARQRAGTLFDVGAFRGLFTLVFCAARRDNRAVLFEPSPAAIADARLALARNTLLRAVVIRPAAVGGEAATVAAAVDGVGFIDFRAAALPLSVQVVRLDDEMERLGIVPTVIKVDVEGAELDVLRGATRVLAHHPTVFLELHLDALRQRGQDPAAVLSLLAGAGYRLYTHSGRRLAVRRVAGSLKAVVRLVAR